MNISMAHKSTPKKNYYKKMTFIIFEILLKFGVQLRPKAHLVLSLYIYVLIKICFFFIQN